MYSVASKDDYVPPAVKEKKKTKGGKMGNAAATATAAEGTGNGTADAASSTADEWSQEQQVRERGREDRFRPIHVQFRQQKGENVRRTR